MVSGSVIKNVADHAGVCARTVGYWIADFKWRERYSELLDKAAEKENAKTVKLILRTNEDYRKIIAKAVDKFTRDLDSNKVPISRVAEFVKLANLDLALQGQLGSENANINIITASPSPPSPAVSEPAQPTIMEGEIVEEKSLPTANIPAKITSSEDESDEG